MSEPPNDPFPELQALDQKQSLPLLSELLGEDDILPAPPGPLPLPERRSTLQVPSFPGPITSCRDPILLSPFRKPSPVEDMPVSDHEETIRETLAALMAEDLEDPLPPSPAPPLGASPSPKPSETPAPPAAPTGIPTSDQELSEALRPVIESSLSSTLSSSESTLQQFLEPMLRTTVRRAIAEQMDTSRQFRPIGAFDRLGMRLLALITGRSYEDIIFDRTRRYQVEEVYLLERNSQSLLSYASHDPARHVSLRRIHPTVQALRSKLRGSGAALESTFDLPERRLALVRQGEFTLLVAILRGSSNVLIRADLDYILRQIEDRFGNRLQDRSDAFLTVLQPLLEGCLLIQSPAPPL